MLSIIVIFALLTGCSPINDPRRKRVDLPSFISHGREFDISQGNNVILDCKVSNLNDFVVVWSKEGRIISEDDEMLERKNGKVRITPDYGLEIVEVGPKDAGRYTCHIDVYGDPIRIAHTLNVIVPPEITSWNNSLQAKSGELLTLSCTAEGNPPPTITWTRHSNGKVLSSVPGMYGRTVLGPLRKVDADIYICTAENQFKHKTTQMTQVEVLYAPEIQIEENWLKKEFGVWDVELICDVSSNPSAEIAWYQAPKRRLSTDDRMLLETRDNKMILRIERMEEALFSNYTCEADNALGKLSSTIELTGRPHKPRLMIHQHNIVSQKTEYNVSWATDSFAPITDYFLYYRKNKAGKKMSDEDWSEVAIPVTSMGQGMTYQGYYTIKNLENKVVYDVIVRAQNMYGMSPKSYIFNFYVDQKGTDVSPLQLPGVMAENQDQTNTKVAGAKTNESPGVYSHHLLLMVLAYLLDLLVQSTN